MKEQKICFMCGKPATTRDHIPPKSIFPPGRRRNLIKVDACDSCNGGTKLDDEYFRDACLLGIDEGRFPDAMKYSLEKIEQLSINPEKRRYGWACYKSVVEVPIFTEAGIYLGKAGARDLDRERLCRCVEKYARGLYFHHFKERIAEGFEVMVVFELDLLEEEKHILLPPNTSSPAYNIGDGAFTYRFVRTKEDSRYATCGLCFYGNLCFLAIIAPPTEKPV